MINWRDSDTCPSHCYNVQVGDGVSFKESHPDWKDDIMEEWGTYAADMFRRNPLTIGEIERSLCNGIYS